MPTAPFPNNHQRRDGAPRLVLPILLLCAAAVNAGEAAPLPPPPELIGEAVYGLDFGDETPTATPDEIRSALEPPTPVAAIPAPSPTVAAPQPSAWSTAPAYSAPVVESTPAMMTSVYSDFTMSPPSTYMPEEYYNLPMAEEPIPGVLLPVLDDTFSDPGYRQAVASARRTATPGLTIRQLEPFFALAKGSESTALDARTRGNEPTYHDQIGKAIDAYAAIVDMADAGTEAREEAWYGIARCEYRRGNWWLAFEALERSFPKEFDKGEVAGRIKLEMFIGERLWRLGADNAPHAIADGANLSGYQAAARVYAAAVHNLPTAEEAPVALLRQGDAASLEGEWERAVRLYRQVVQYYPESDQAMQARSSLTEAVYRQDWPGGLPEAGREDVGSLMDDVERQYGRLSPEAEERRQKAVKLANDLEAETKLRQAKSYLRQIRVKKSRDAAVFLLGDVVSRFPATDQAVEAADILRGMGIDPPMVLFEGNRFPLTAGWSGTDMEEPGDRDAVLGGGSAQLQGQDDIFGSASSTYLPPSPTRETVYEPLAIPGVIEPGQ